MTLSLFCAAAMANNVDHSKHKMKANNEHVVCESTQMACSKTISSVITPNGRIWSTWVHQRHLYLNYSDNLGQRYSTPIKVNATPEAISTRGENRPKIALDGQGNVNLSWVTPLKKRFTANVRFSYFNITTQKMSPAITVNNDNLLTGHSFNEMKVSDSGDVFISWLDGRAKFAAAKQGVRLRSSELYLGHANFLQGKYTFDNNFLAKGTCVCCRLAMDLDDKDLPLVMWRHVFGDNFRDHGFLTMKNQHQANEMKRVSFENWQVNGCPHQGGTIVRETVGKNTNRVHMAWFNNAKTASGLFYSFSDDNGSTMHQVDNFATKAHNPEHPFLSQSVADKNVQSQINMVWREFDGEQFQIKYRFASEVDQWSESRVVATSEEGVDYPYILEHPTGSYLQWHIAGKPLALIKL